MRTVVAAGLRKARSIALGNTEDPSLAGKAKRSTTLGRELRTCTSLLGKPKTWN